MARQTDDLVGDSDLRWLTYLARIAPRLNSIVASAGVVWQIGAAELIGCTHVLQVVLHSENVDIGCDQGAPLISIIGRTEVIE